MPKHIFLKNNRGVAAVEFALILPVLLAILLGVLEFGVYFTKSSVVSRAVSSTSTAIQMSPTATNLQTDAQNSGFGLVSFTGNNFFCALSYSTRELAGNYCTAGQWSTGLPAGHPAGTPYYVAVVASVRNQPISGITGFLPPMVTRNIVQVGGASGTSKLIGYKAYTFNPPKVALLYRSDLLVVPNATISYTPVKDQSTVVIKYQFHISGGPGSVTPCSLLKLVVRNGYVGGSMPLHFTGEMTYTFQHVYQNYGFSPITTDLRASRCGTGANAADLNVTRIAEDATNYERPRPVTVTFEEYDAQVN
jgi:Flp pilus assembly pilin Flp